MMKPRVQMPHWKPPSCQNAFWIGCSPSRLAVLARLATVIIFWPRPSLALSMVTAQVGVRQTELVVHGLPQRVTVVDHHVVAAAIDVERDTAHRGRNGA